MAQLNLMLSNKLDDESWEPIRDISVNTMSKLLQRFVASPNCQPIVHELFSLHCPFVHQPVVSLEGTEQQPQPEQCNTFEDPCNANGPPIALQAEQMPVFKPTTQPQPMRPTAKPQPQRFSALSQNQPISRLPVPQVNRAGAVPPSYRPPAIAVPQARGRALPTPVNPPPAMSHLTALTPGGFLKQSAQQNARGPLSPQPAKPAPQVVKPASAVKQETTAETQNEVPQITKPTNQNLVPTGNEVTGNEPWGKRVPATSSTQQTQSPSEPPAKEAACSSATTEPAPTMPATSQPVNAAQKTTTQTPNLPQKRPHSALMPPPPYSSAPNRFRRPGTQPLYPQAGFLAPYFPAQMQSYKR